jgi:putative hydrolase of the HAD superfamily
MKQYKDLFIDFDDTLYDTYGNAVIALRETFDYFQLKRYFSDPQLFYDSYWEANIDLWSRYSRDEITRDNLIVERFRRPLSEGKGIKVTKEFCLEVSDRFLDFCSNKPGVVDGAHEVMDYLKKKGYRMHMTSNGFHEVQYKKLAACGLKDYFDNIILSEDAKYNKPSKAYFDYALKIAGAQSDSVLMIGDNLNTDILGALHAGLDAMLFNRWQVDVSSVTPQPTFVVDQLRDIIKIL